MGHKINPDWVSAPLDFVMMTKDGCYRLEDGKRWMRFCGYSEDLTKTVWQEVDEKEVPEAFRLSKSIYERRT